MAGQANTVKVGLDPSPFSALCCWHVIYPTCFASQPQALAHRSAGFCRHPPRDRRTDRPATRMAGWVVPEFANPRDCIRQPRHPPPRHRRFCPAHICPPARDRHGRRLRNQRPRTGRRRTPPHRLAHQRPHRPPGHHRQQTARSHSQPHLARHQRTPHFCRLADQLGPAGSQGDPRPRPRHHTRLQNRRGTRQSPL